MDPHATLHRPTEQRACILAWSLTRGTKVVIDAAQLRSLQSEIHARCETIGATPIEAAATHGVLRINAVDNTNVSVEDSAVQLGRLLCRWAHDQEPECRLRVGVHVGELRSLQLPNLPLGGHFGEAISTACQLADGAPKDMTVSFLGCFKTGLIKFERLPMTVHAAQNIPSAEAFSIDWWAEPPADQDPTTHAMSPLATPSGGDSRRPFMFAMSSSPDIGESDPAVANNMSLEEFTEYLRKHNVDIDSFGRGQAKRLADFYQDIVHRKKSYLMERDGKLERNLEIFRITLIAADADGVERMLMVALEIMPDGRTRRRQQKLGGSVQYGETWEEAIRTFFADRFGISKEAQQQVLEIKDNWYKEERQDSASVPGIPTTYLTHEVRMCVVNPHHPSLAGLGMPDMRDFTASGYNENRQLLYTWKNADVEADVSEQLAQLLREHHINPSEFEAGAFSELLEEVYETQVSELSVVRGELQRKLQIVKVWLSADILTEPHYLVTLSKMQRGRRHSENKDRPLSKRMRREQEWQEALQEALQSKLGLDPSFQASKILVDTSSYRILEEVEYSHSYPGLKTVYRIHEVTCRCLDAVPLLGLPEGNDFAFSRIEGGDNVATYFTWKSQQDLASARSSMVVRDPSLLGKVAKTSIQVDVTPDPKRRVPAPPPLNVPPVEKDASSGRCCAILEHFMNGKVPDWKRAKNAALRIRDKDYSCRAFFEDCSAAFPELALYLAVGAEEAGTSGRSLDDEYQRTIGALFAFYWMMRLDTDGREAFAFGVGGENWEPLSEASSSPVRPPDEISRRLSFFQQAEWTLFQDVFVMAGMEETERRLTMLVLTAIHDIMKIKCFQPVVERFGAFCGYKPGESINDHDTALAYVLERKPELLPSFARLAAHQRESVKFTQCHMDFNMGWLVQAEAPPGPLFRKFKAVIRAGKANPCDIAFYFAHWLTDLAGAEPYPLEGCEKFVLKFPQRVLASFLRSIPFVQGLHKKSETAVLEDYLRWRWRQQDPVPPMISGAGTVAQLRLIAMAQKSEARVLEAYRSLPAADKAILHEELARTGCKGQNFSLDSNIPQGGPAFLVYYAPALLQRNATTDPGGALSVLAEVLRRARDLWPLSVAVADGAVTVRIDVLKDLEVEELQRPPNGMYWCLVRTTDVDGMVKRASLHDPKSIRQRPLCFGGALVAPRQKAQAALAAGRDLLLVPPSSQRPSRSHSPPRGARDSSSLSSPARGPGYAGKMSQRGPFKRPTEK